MRHPVVLALAAVATAYVYLGALGYAMFFAASLPLPVAFSSSGTAVLSWSSFSHSIAVLLASVPFAWLLRGLYGKFSIHVAFAMGVVIWLLLDIPFVIDAYYFPRLWSPWFADTLVYVLALPTLVWLLGRLPSNNRWGV